MASRKISKSGNPVLGNVLGKDLSSLKKKCSTCGSEKSGNDFYSFPGKGKIPSLYLFSECKDCSAKKTAEDRRNPDKRKVWLEYGRKSTIRRRYSVEIEKVEALLREQQEKCAICGVPQNKLDRRLAIDHNHKTGKIRGLLCSNCNNGLGRFKDNKDFLKQAINYLEKTDAQ